MTTRTYVQTVRSGQSERYHFFHDNGPMQNRQPLRCRLPNARLHSVAFIHSLPMPMRALPCLVCLAALAGCGQKQPAANPQPQGYGSQQSAAPALGGAGAAQTGSFTLSGIVAAWSSGPQAELQEKMRQQEHLIARAERQDRVSARIARINEAREEASRSRERANSTAMQPQGPQVYVAVAPGAADMTPRQRISARIQQVNTARTLQPGQAGFNTAGLQATPAPASASAPIPRTNLHGERSGDKVGLRPGDSVGLRPGDQGITNKGAGQTEGAGRDSSASSS